MSGKLLSVSEVAERLNCSETWVNDPKLQAELRPYVLGNGHKVYLSDLVEEYAARRDAEREAKAAKRAELKRAAADGGRR